MPDLLMHLDYYYVSIKVLLIFLIAFIPYSRRCPQLVKAKVLGPYLYYQFFPYHQECLLTLIILA